MKILIIGGTGTISSAITRQLAESGHDLWLLNRGTRKQEVPASVKQIIADMQPLVDYKKESVSNCHAKNKISHIQQQKTPTIVGVCFIWFKITRAKILNIG